MNWKDVGRLVAVAGLLCAPSAPASQGPDLAAVTQVMCGRGSGTAFHIGDGRWITAAHVSSNGPCSIGGVPVQTVLQDGHNDVAELRGPLAPAVLRFHCRGPRPGRLYRAIGYIYMGEFVRVILPWQATTWREGPNNPNVFMGEAIPGMSGGPLIDSEGRVVGVTIMRLPARARSLEETHLCSRS